MCELYWCENELCVKERGKERYCCRAGVMSRNEGGEEEALSIRTSLSQQLKAQPLTRATVVREGMSASEFRVTGIPFSVTKRGYLNVQLGSGVVSDVSLGRSIRQFLFVLPLRMINSLEGSSWKKKAV